MATNKKITELVELSEDALADDDMFVMVDVSANATKKIRRDTLASLLGVSSLTATSPLAVDQSTGSVTVSTGTIPVSSGGTGATSLTDGGVLLGSGTGAVTAMSVLTDGQMIVGNGSTDPVAESGATLRTSIGVGTGDSPQFTDLTLTDDLYLDSDSAVIHLGDDGDVTLTHVADTGLLLNSTRQLQFGDSGTYIHQSADGVLDLVSDTEIEINATTIDINGAVDVSGAYTGGGLMTTGGNIVIPDAGNIGSASDTDAIAISSGGVVTMNQIPVFSAGINVSGGTIAGTLSTAAQGNVTSLGTLTTLTVDNVIINGTTIGHTSDTDLLTLTSGVLTVAGELDATTLDISGDADIDGTLEADAMTLNGTAITATATLDTGIGNNNVPKFTSGVADDDFLRVDGTAIEGRSAAEVLSDIAAAPAAGSSNIVTTGALNAGSITSGFGAIDNGSSNITTTGDISGGTINATSDTAAGDNAAVGYTATEGLILTGQGSTSDLTVKNDADETVFSIPTGTDDVIFPDSAQLQFGGGSDLRLVHDGNNSYIIDQGTGGLYIQGDTFANIGSPSGETGLSYTKDGSIDLYHDNVKKFETTSTGVSVTGDVAATGTVEPAGDTAAGDNAAVGYTATEGLILTGQGSTSDLTVKNDADETVFSIPTGTDDLRFPDNAQLQLGTDGDLVLYHAPEHSYIQEGGSGNLYIQGTNLYLQGRATGETMLGAVENGAVELYYDAAKKLETVTGGVEVTGYLDADNFKVNGAQGSDGEVLTSTGSGVAWEAAGGGGGVDYDIIHSSTSPSTSTYIDCDGYKYIKCIGVNAGVSSANYGIGIYTNTSGGTVSTSQGYYLRLEDHEAVTVTAYSPDSGTGYFGDNWGSDEFITITEVFGLGGSEQTIQNHVWTDSITTTVGHWVGKAASSSLRYVLPKVSFSAFYVIGVK